MASVIDTYIFGNGEGPIVDSNLIAHYDFQNDLCYPETGTDVYDLTSNNNDGTVNDVSIFVATAPQYTTSSYSGPSREVDIPFTAIDGASAVTFEIWCRCRTQASAGTILCQYGTGSTMVPQILSWTNSKLRIYFNSPLVYRESASTIRDDIWRQMVFVFNASTNLDIYLNGVLDNGALSGSIPATIPTSIDNLQFHQNTSTGARLTGDIAIVRIYDTALNSTQINQNFDAQKSRFGIT